VIITKARIKLTIAYRIVTRSANPWPSVFGNCCRVMNYDAMCFTYEKTSTIRVVNVKVVFGFIVTSKFYSRVTEVTGPAK